ncbi:CAF1-domain-containing protein [Multifurca ochricompacta]|uniref:poly(A)-specific ribonuclease n=1 Tax=Multifurca ochricompacta TaxID=376703 RepID=A0AAD4M4B4_9AGAM|nr:CAF1-domain-containing protein [Multifurca ochricompacta]
MTPIREVWAPNLDLEMRNIRDLIDKYPYVALDTEFPGVVARPIGTFKTSSDYHYQTMRCNVDLLKIIQIGLTLSDDDGDYPQEVSTWQFNFHFSINEDMFAPESVELLQKDWDTPNDFAELMITSGLVLTDETRWISFHSGYDFGYFIKLLTALSLPTTEEDFFEKLHKWFPVSYDMKTMMRAVKGLKGGLQDVADDLGVMRIGPSHQAGSDSLLTASTFFKMRELYFREHVDYAEFNGKLYGLGETFSQTNGPPDPGRGGATPAEREDRRVDGSLTASAVPNVQVSAQMPPGAGYGPMTTNGAFMRASIGVGGGAVKLKA